ncbi:MAG: carbohydrate ABC transporter permease [Sphaerochaeta sp.]|nr:carbohydrate ABC transporter permease [Sphaerochaeta sp.]
MKTQRTHPIIHIVLLVFVIVWIVPTLGLLVTSFRTVDDMSVSGWWTAFKAPGRFTLENYKQVLSSGNHSYVTESGRQMNITGGRLKEAFLNSLSVTIPSVVIPILIAAFAAYGFAKLRFYGRKLFFGIVVAMLVVPVQISLIPILRDYQKIGLAGTYLGVWLFHTAFGLPLATYLLFNFISTIPESIIESAYIDGADNFVIFVRLIIPLSLPALASFSIFQFLWVWNDLLVPMVFLSGAGPGNAVLTQRLLSLVGQFGANWQLLTAAAFVSMMLPLVIFLSLQRYFVKGLLTGSVKG